MRFAYADFETSMFDFEREEYTLNAEFVVIKLDNQHYVFKSAKAFVDFLDRNSSYRNKLVVFFHNFKFDSLFFIEELSKKFKFIFPLYSGSKLLRLRVGNFFKTEKKRNRKRFEWKIEFRDSFALIPSSLRKIGKSLGLEKGNTIESSQSFESFVEYCKRDVDILELAINRLIDVVNEKTSVKLRLDNLPLTSPSLAKLIFNQMMRKKNIKRKEIYNDIYDDELRQFYFGGRTEVFDLNFHNDVYYNDFNSAYPYIMHHNAFPLAPYHKVYCQTIEELLSFENLVGALVVIDETNIDVPMFPERFNSKVLFLASKKEIFLFKEEIEKFIEYYSKDRILEIKYALICSRYEYIFRDYVEIFYKLKSEAENESYERLLYKLMLNSLYGKFGEAKEKESIRIYKDFTSFLEEHDEQELVNAEETSVGVVYRKKIENRVHNNILIAMRITALTRLHLYTYMKRAGFENVIYCDSDSIVSKKLIENSKELGKMSPEFKATLFRALGCKEYYYEEDKNVRVKMKGFSIKEKLTYEEFLKIYQEGHKVHQILSIKQCLIRNKKFGTCVNMIKEKRTFYDKRKINYNLTTSSYSKYEYEDVAYNNEQIIKQKILNIV